MLRISKMTDYATLVTNVLAHEAGAKLSAVEIAERAHLPQPTVSKVLKMLVQAGILVSYRGAEGGYQLSKKPEDISLADLLRGMEGPMAITECNLHEGVCEQENTCALQGNWLRVNKIVLDVLEGISLADMTQPLPETIQFYRHDQAAMPYLPTRGGCKKRP